MKFIEIVLKCENDFEISEFYRGQTFSSKVEKLSFLGNFEFWEMVAGGAPALRVTRAETWLTVYRSLPYRNSS